MTLRETTNTSTMLSPQAEGPLNKQQPKTPLRKEDLEKIAKQLKHKLSRASIAAKRSMSPGPRQEDKLLAKSPSPLSPATTRTRPLEYRVRKLTSRLFGSSPIGKSPTQMKTPTAVFLSSSPLKNSVNDRDELKSPTTRGTTGELGSSPIAYESERMVLQAVAPPSTPPRSFAALKPSPSLQATPNLQKRPLAVNTQHNALLRTPTQPLQQPAVNKSNDNEGADLLMYLATSPSPAKPPRVAVPTGPQPYKPNNNNFVAPAPPLTPKRPITTMARTPQNRMTPQVNLFSNGLTAGGANGLPSSGLMLTPGGFNMSDYFNFFTPLPGGHNLHKGFMKTPDFNPALGHSGSSLNQVAKLKVDGKMINFDKVGLFNEKKDQ